MCCSDVVPLSGVISCASSVRKNTCAGVAACSLATRATVSSVNKRGLAVNVQNDCDGAAMKCSHTFAHYLIFNLMLTTKLANLDVVAGLLVKSILRDSRLDARLAIQPTQSRSIVVVGDAQCTHATFVDLRLHCAPHCQCIFVAFQRRMQHERVQVRQFQILQT
jgi:hypothetical protein